MEQDELALLSTVQAWNSVGFLSCCETTQSQGPLNADNVFVLGPIQGCSKWGWEGKKEKPNLTAAGLLCFQPWLTRGTELLTLALTFQSFSYPAWKWNWRPTGGRMNKWTVCVEPLSLGKCLVLIFHIGSHKCEVWKQNLIVSLCPAGSLYVPDKSASVWTHTVPGELSDNSPPQWPLANIQQSWGEITCVLSRLSNVACKDLMTGFTNMEGPGFVIMMSLRWEWGA